MAHFEAILFDKDGTLFDFQATWSLWALRALEHLSAGDWVLKDVLADVLGFDLGAGRFRKDSLVIAETSAAVADALMPFLPEGGPDRRELVGILNAIAAETPQAPSVDLGPYLDGLVALGYRVGVVTNDAEAPARTHLAEAGALDRFGFVAGYDSGHGAKPGPGQILAAARHWDIAPECMVMVGDSAHDLIAGRRAGTSVVGVLTGVASAEDLSPLADAVLSSIADLPAWLARSL